MLKLIEIQKRLKAPKSQVNQHTRTRYRSAEDILEAVKPLLVEAGLLLTLSDEAVMVGDRYYIKVTASVTDGKETVSNTAYAREGDSLAGMSAPQISGACSSYARKYALNGLFAIDDSKEVDELPPVAKQAAPKRTPMTAAQVEMALKSAKSLDALGAIWKSIGGEWQTFSEEQKKHLTEVKDNLKTKLK